MGWYRQRAFKKTVTVHIAFLLPEYPHNSLRPSGGLGTSTRNLAAALALRDVQVSVIVYDQAADAHFEENGIAIHTLRSMRFPVAGWYLHRLHIAKEVRRLIVEKGIDLVEVPDWTGISAFMKLDVPVVMRFHGSDTYFCHIEGRQQKIKNRIFEFLAARNATAFIAPSTFAGAVSSKLFRLKNPVKVIPYGLDLAHFQNPDPTDYEPYNMLYLGTVIRKKGVLELPRIFRLTREQLPQSRLLIIGGDSSDQLTGAPSTLEMLFEMLEPDDRPFVTYAGIMPYAEVRNAIRRAHVCVFPTFAETFGMVTVECMAMNKAVVNSNIGWANELMVDEESGLLVNPRDASAFASAVVGLFTDANRTLRIGAAARAFVDTHFDSDEVAKANIAFYKQTLANGSNRS